jgi:hypothetical protein
MIVNYDHKTFIAQVTGAYLSPQWVNPKVNGREPKSCLDRVFNSQVGIFTKLQCRSITCVQPNGSYGRAKVL